MSKLIIRYGLLFTGSLVLALSIWWLANYLQEPNLISTGWQGDFYQQWYQMAESSSDLQMQPLEEQSFEVAEDKMVFVKYLKYSNLTDFILEGRIEVLSEQGQILYVFDMLGENLNRKIDLSAGRYQLRKTLALRPEAVKQFFELSDSEREELKAGNEGDYQFSIHVF